MFSLAFLGFNDQRTTKVQVISLTCLNRKKCDDYTLIGVFTIKRITLVVRHHIVTLYIVDNHGHNHQQTFSYGHHRIFWRLIFYVTCTSAVNVVA